jgi:hypothetical protein
VFFPFLELTPSGKRQKHTSKELQFYVTSFRNQMQTIRFGNAMTALPRADFFKICCVGYGVLTSIFCLLGEEHFYVPGCDAV